MPILVVQFQPGRAPHLDPDTVSRLMLNVALNSAVRLFSIQRPRRGDSYVNFAFDSPVLRRVWAVFQRQALDHRKLGRALRRSMIVTCEGSRSWSNYRLLHHFDGRQRPDSLT